jgi:radical SAM superfamily enzyme YgiQ (UPF0313 family)
LHVMFRKSFPWELIPVLKALRAGSLIMKALLISANTSDINMPTLPLGLVSVATATKAAGHEVEVIDLLASQEPLAQVKTAIEKQQPEVIGIAVRNIDDQSMENTKFLLQEVRDVVAACRSHSSALIILGGAGYSIFPEGVLAYLDADAGIQGEGEAAFPVLLEKLQQGARLADIPGIYLPGQGLKGERLFLGNLDSIPFPDEHLWTIPPSAGEDILIPLQTRRGCALGCNYCSTATIEGTALRKRSVEKVVDGLSRHAARGFKRFYFTDNTFNMPPSYALDLCRAIIRRRLDITWVCIIYPGNIKEELIRAMADAGCREVSLGFESGSEKILRVMNKKYNLSDVRRTSALLARYKIKQLGFLLLGGPGETKESVEESLTFADSLALDAMKISIGIRIYPYTELAQTAVADGLITPNDDLLLPRFYMVPGLEAWLRETVARWMETRPHWTM